MILTVEQFNQARFNVYMKALNELAVKKVKSGEYDKVEYDIRIKMVGASMGIPAKVSRDNFNRAVKAWTEYRKTKNKDVLAFRIYIE